MFTSASDVLFPCSFPASAKAFPFPPFSTELLEPSWGMVIFKKSWIAPRFHSWVIPDRALTLHLVNRFYRTMAEKLGSLLFFSALRSTTSPILGDFKTAPLFSSTYASPLNSLHQSLSRTSSLGTISLSLSPQFWKFEPLNSHLSPRTVNPTPLI